MDYKYDVAFSLEKGDTEIARQINDLIKNRLSTFVYFENKETIASQDGLNIFYDIFLNQSRVVIVLFSEKWGNTDWTSKEETAIRNRIVKSSWDFIIFVKMDKKFKTPEWYPSTHIWIDYQDFGAKGVARVIEAKVNELGGKVMNESTIQKAKRLSEEKENMRKIRNILEMNPEGIERANTEIINLFTICRKRVEYLTENARNLNFIISREEHNYIQIKAQIFVLNIEWWPVFSNSLDGAHLDVSIRKRIKKGLSSGQDYDKLFFTSYVFNINPSWENGWSVTDYNGHFYTSEQLIDYWLDIIIEKLN